MGVKLSLGSYSFQPLGKKKIRIQPSLVLFLFVLRLQTPAPTGAAEEVSEGSDLLWKESHPRLPPASSTPPSLPSCLSYFLLGPSSPARHLREKLCLSPSQTLVPFPFRE